MDTTFRDRTWKSRFGAMGDEAELAFERYCQDTNRNYVRFGLNRPPLAVGMLPTRIRYTPDYLTTHAFVECQGFGRDQKIKLKLEKLNSLLWWQDVHPVELFLWDSKHERHAIVSVRRFLELLDGAKGTLNTFQEGKAYVEWDAADVFDAS